jgi:hypothetical protein
MRAHICMLTAFLLVQHTALAAESTLERQFAQEREGLACVEASTNEPSCSGTGMAVYLRGDQVQALDWTVEMSTKYIREQYYFRGSVPALVVETIQAKLDSEANRLEKPKLLSITRYRLEDAGQSKRRKEFLKHVEVLLRDFHERRVDFTPCGHPNT